jgi:ribonuclease III
MDLDALEKLLGYEFRDRKLLERSLTHRSWAHERSGGEEQNEALEFVGDSVVGLIIAETLYRSNPGMSEGDLTLMKHRLVSTRTLAGIAKEMGLGEFIRLGRGEERTGGREKQALLADTLEAVLGAVFFDGSYDGARQCAARIFARELENASPEDSNDYKTLLQEKLQARRLAAPKYALLKAEGMPHARTFVVEATWEGGRTEGIGRSIKAAEMMAASRALAELNGDGEPQIAKEHPSDD